MLLSGGKVLAGLPKHKQEPDLRHRHKHVDPERLEGLHRPQRRGELVRLPVGRVMTYTFV